MSTARKIASFYSAALWQGATSIVDRKLGQLDELLPQRDFFGDEVAERIGAERHDLRIVAHLSKTFAQSAGIEGALDRPGHLVDSLARRAGRRQKANQLATL